MNTISTEIKILNKVLDTGDISLIRNNDLGPEYFPVYQNEYKFIVDHFQKYGNVPDQLTFMGQFKNFDLIPTRESDDFLLDSIKEDFVFTNLMPVMQKAHNLSKDGAIEAVNYLRGQLPKLEVTTSTSAIDITKEGADLRFDKYINRSEVPSFIGSGFDELDNIIHGFEMGEELVTLLARPNQGKSWLLTAFGMAAWLQNYRVGMYSGEMEAANIGYRFDTLYKQFSNRNLTFGNEQEAERYRQYIEFLKKWPVPFFIKTRKEMDGRATVPKLERFVEANELDYLIVDQFSLVDDYRCNKMDQTRTQYAHIAEDLFGLSCKYKIPVIAASQAHRVGVDGIDEPPTLDDIAESDGIAQNSSKVISIRQKEGTLQMKMRKNRNEGLGNMLVYTWDIDKGVFTYIPQSDYVPNNKVDKPMVRPNNEDDPIKVSISTLGDISKFNSGVEVF